MKDQDQDKYQIKDRDQDQDQADNHCNVDVHALCKWSKISSLGIF